MGEFAGRLVWRELMTTEPEKAAAFYGELFNWSTRLMDMGAHGEYRLQLLGERMVGGIGQAPAGTPSSWMTYISVDDVDAAVAKATELGGSLVQAPFDVPDVGRMAFVADPSGAVFAPFRSETPGAGGDPEPEPSAFCWSQLMTTDRSVASFYEAIAGWTAAPMPTGGTVFLRGETMTASVTDLPEEARAMGAPSHWLDYVAVEDVGETLTRANRLGAQTLVDVTEVPNMGIFAIVRDPVGATVAFWKHLGD